MGLSEESFWSGSLAKIISLINKHIEIKTGEAASMQEVKEIVSMKEIAGW